MIIMTSQGFSRVIWAIRRAGRAVGAAKEQQLRPFGLSAPHYTMLAAIAFAPGATGAEVARNLGVTPQNVVGLAARLEQRGLVVRQPHPRHRHVVELRITEEGDELLQVADSAMIELEKRIGRILGEDRAENLRSMLETLAHGLESEFGAESEDSETST